MVTQQALTAGVIGLLVAATLAALAVHALRWRRGELPLSREHFGLRVLGALVLVAIWLLIGTMLLAEPLSHPGLFFGCFYAVLLLALALVLLAAVDLAWLRRRQERASLGLVEQFIHEAMQPPGDSDES